MAAIAEAEDCKLESERSVGVAAERRKASLATCDATKGRKKRKAVTEQAREENRDNRV